jgi:hypothetical protein
MVTPSPGFAAEFGQADFLEVRFGEHRHGVGQVFQCRRERLFQVQTDAVVTGFFGALDPVHVLQGDDFGVGGYHPVEGEDHIVGGEGITVVKFDAFAQFEIDGGVVDLLPAGGQHGFVFATFWIAVNQVVPDQPPENHAFAQVIVIRADIFRFAVGSVNQSVVGFAGPGREAADGAEQRNTESETFDAHAVVSVGESG